MYFQVARSYGQSQKHVIFVLSLLQIFLPEAKSNHKLLNSTDYGCRFLHKYECKAIAHQKSNQENVRKFSSGRPHHRSIIISKGKEKNIIKVMSKNDISFFGQKFNYSQYLILKFSFFEKATKICPIFLMVLTTDYGRPVRKLPSLHGRK